MNYEFCILLQTLPFKVLSEISPFGRNDEGWVEMTRMVEMTRVYDGTKFPIVISKEERLRNLKLLLFFPILKTFQRFLPSVEMTRRVEMTGRSEGRTHFRTSFRRRND